MTWKAEAGCYSLLLEGMGLQPGLLGLGPGLGEAGGEHGVLILAMKAMRAMKVVAFSSLYGAPLPLGPPPLGLSFSFS